MQTVGNSITLISRTAVAATGGESGELASLALKVKHRSACVRLRFEESIAFQTLSLSLSLSLPRARLHISLNTRRGLCFNIPIRRKVPFEIENESTVKDLSGLRFSLDARACALISSDRKV